MHSNPNRIKMGVVWHLSGTEFREVLRTPNGRVLVCCDSCGAPNGRKHGRYTLPEKRWEKSLRDHK